MSPSLEVQYSTRGLTCELSDQLLDGFIADVPRSSPALPLLSGTNLARGEGAAAEPPCDLRPRLKSLRLCATGDPYAAGRLRAVGWRPGAWCAALGATHHPDDLTTL